MEDNKMKKKGKNTRCVHGGTYEDPNIRGVNTPIFTSTSFAYLDTDERSYPRYFNTVNQQVLAEKMRLIEGGEDALIFSSGMAAISTTVLSFLKQGDHAVFQQGLYGGTFHFIKNDLENRGIRYTILENNSRDSFRKAVNRGTRLVYIESPSNPLLAITDIRMVADIARENGIVSVIDNTFASPVNQNPISLGIDVVVHSATKYLGGHSDICAGAAVSSLKNIERIRNLAHHLGGSLDPHTCYLLERSIKTLNLRVERQNRNATDIAEFLERNPHVDRVFYPGLENHECHRIAAGQMSGYGGMVSFEIGNPDADSFQKKLKLIKPSMSLGGVESIICAPAATSHRNLSKQERERAGIKDSLLRLSVGIEDVSDLIDDIDQALG